MLKSVNEIVQNVDETAEIAITIVHLHARDEHTDEPTFRAEIYCGITDGIRKYSKE